MINVANSSSQKIDVTSFGKKQKIVVKNIEEQNISVNDKSEQINIQVVNADLPQKIIIGVSGQSQVDLSTVVPKELSVLTKAQIDQFRTAELRSASRIYVDIDGDPSYATLEQIKELNTKTILVDTLNDIKIYGLSKGDFALLKER